MPTQQFAPRVSILHFVHNAPHELSPDRSNTRVGGLRPTVQKLRWSRHHVGFTKNLSPFMRPHEVSEVDCTRHGTARNAFMC